MSAAETILSPEVVTGAQSDSVQRLVTPPTPYHEQDGIRIFCGDNRQIAPLLGQYDLLHTDPPYGIGVGKRKIWGTSNKGKCSEYAKSDWDDAPPESWELQMMMAKARWQIIWGGNYFGLPAARGWLVWDKDNTGDFADAELAWTNLEMAVRKIKWRWNGMLQQNMVEKETRWHPTQKPQAVMEWATNFAPDAQTVLDPWMGSGTMLLAARAKGLKADGIEINEQYCEAAKRRLAQGVLLAV